jgi:CRISPR-associated protein (TIGR03986 family)
MTPKHTDPILMRYDEKSDLFANARAPYNFVPLPEKMVEAKTPPPQDRYDPDLLTGWIDCTLETCSPTYIRGMMTEVQYKEFGQTGSSELTDEQKKTRAPFFSSSEKELEGFLAPVIPGSSLRGMIRAIVEVIGYGRMRWVGNKPTVTFRAVAAESNDPLKNPYRDLLGSNGKNVRAGYLVKVGERWFVQPAHTPKDENFKTNDRYYLKIDDEDLNPRDLPGFIKMFEDGYKPQVRAVSFQSGPRKSKRTDPTKTRPVVVVKPVEAGLTYRGTLVCSGNMTETGGAKQESPRTKHYIVMPAGNSPLIPIPQSVVDDYRDGLTPFQKENLTDWAGGDWGCLAQGKPVFYVADNPDRPQEIAFFGHSPNFRIPARPQGHDRAATPFDFVPEDLRTNTHPDLADAIFGWVEEKDWGPAGQCAGRVFFGDAHFEHAEQGIWYSLEPITPRTLAGPKATTFQHYLVQDKSLQHDPEYKARLAHYGTPQKETVIRGHKFYWFKGANPDIKASEKDLTHQTQLTQIIPIKPKVHFAFRITFENLRAEELGVLCWALNLPGKKGTTYRHHLGMGKPLGMGAVALKPAIHLTPRVGKDSRYDKLFEGNDWYLPSVNLGDDTAYINEFERFILKDNQIAGNKTRLAEVERIQALLEMLQWRGDTPDAGWLEQTRYMEIEHDADGKQYNEYKERPVLPSPFGIWNELKKEKPAVLQNQPTTHQNEHVSRPRQVEPGHPVEQAYGEYKTGVVKRYGPGKNGPDFGFIKPDGGGEEVYVNARGLRQGVTTLTPGQHVKFQVIPGDRGLRAKNAEPIDK